MFDCVPIYSKEIILFLQGIVCDEYPDGLEVDDDSYEHDDDNSNVEETKEEKAERIARRRRWEEQKQARRQEDLQEYYSDLGHYNDSYGYEDITVEISVDGVSLEVEALILFLFHNLFGGHFSLRHAMYIHKNYRR